jgi:hypothetical protein
MTLYRHLLVVCGCVLSASAPGALPDGLAAYYDFQSGLEDQSGHARHLVTASGTPEAAWAGGTITRGASSVDRNTLLTGNALNLVDVDNDVLKAPLGSGPSTTAAGTYDLGGDFTISAWHLLAPLPDNTSTRYFVFEAEDNFDVSWGISSGDTYVAYVAQTAAGSLSLPRLAWQHVVHVFKTSGSETTIDLFVNGHFVDSMSAPASDMDVDRIVIGDARDAAGDREWDGLLDEIAIWERALSPLEMREVYERGQAGLGVLTDPVAAGKAILSLAAVPAGGGTVSPAWALVNTGSIQTVEALPTLGWRFTGWSGAFAGQSAAFSHTVTSFVNAAASFERDLTDPDGDGLTTYDELVLHGTDPADADSDNDGLADDDEMFITRTNPRSNNAALLAALDSAFSPATSGRLAMTPAEGHAAVSSVQVSVGFLQSTNGVSWSGVALDQAVLDSLSPGSGFRLRFPIQPGAPATWRVLPQAPDEEH